MEIGIGQVSRDLGQIFTLAFFFFCQHFLQDLYFTVEVQRTGIDQMIQFQSALAVHLGGIAGAVKLSLEEAVFQDVHGNDPVIILTRLRVCFLPAVHPFPGLVKQTALQICFENQLIAVTVIELGDHVLNDPDSFIPAFQSS